MDKRVKIIDEMQPLKDYLQGKSSTTEFIEECRQISKTENAEFEIVEPLQLPISEHEDKRSVATSADSSTGDGKQKS